jgi:multidrug resistance protein MdtO
LLKSYAASGFRNEQDEITRLAMAGTSRLRRLLIRSTHSLHYREQVGALVALVGRLVDIAANLTDLNPSENARTRMRKLAEIIASIREDLLSGRVPPNSFEKVGRGVPSAPIPIQRTQTGAVGTPRPTTSSDRAARSDENETSQTVPLLGEMERTVSLLHEALAGTRSLSTAAPLPSGDPPSRLFVPDALSNPDHVKFALKGCLAASLCYLIYTALDWSGISTAVITCVLTALTTIGASRQKQVLRISGAIVGGFIFGMGAQIFILPYLDSIGGFTVLFVTVTLPGAWFATSSPRLSYFGVQLALGFFIVNLQEFGIETSLTFPRDRVVGVLLGLFMMWLVFDQLWGAPAVVEMKNVFISLLHSLAKLTRAPFEPREGIEQTNPLREMINNDFDKVRALSDAVLFEFGPSRQQDLTFRSRITRWQPHLRMLYITRLALLKYRCQLPGFELARPVYLAQLEFDEHLAATLDAIADRLKGATGARTENLQDSFARVEQTIQTSPVSQEVLSSHLQTFLQLSRRIVSLAVSMDQEICEVQHASPVTPPNANIR